MVRSCGMWSGWHWVLFNFGLLFEERDRNLGYQDISGSCGSKEKDYIKKKCEKRRHENEPNTKTHSTALLALRPKPLLGEVASSIYAGNGPGPAAWLALYEMTVAAFCGKMLDAIDISE